MSERDHGVAARLDEAAPAGRTPAGGWEAIIREAEPGGMRGPRADAG